MVNLGSVDFQLGLAVNINVNDGQNKFKVQTLENVAITRPFLSDFDVLPQLNSIFFGLDFGLLIDFCSKALHGQHWAY